MINIFCGVRGLRPLCTFSVMRYYKTLITTCNARFHRSLCYQNGQSFLPNATCEKRETLLLPSRKLYSTIVSKEQDKVWTSSSQLIQPNSWFADDPVPYVSHQAFVEQISTKALYNGIVENFPSGIQMAFAYGSGAIQQGGSTDMKKNMLDFIFVVDRPRKWHRENLKRHPNHYSFLRHLGSRTIARVQERYGAGVYFNTLVPMEGRLIKYGVISTARLITDLLDWESLYLAGRLHKPVTLIVMPTDENLLTALRVNLKSAMHAALLLLPDMFSEEQFFTCIASLSYSGDCRMVLAEDSNKVMNIVRPNLPLFRRMYSSFVLNQEHMTWWQEEGQMEQALTFRSRQYHLTRLPAQVLYGLISQQYKAGVFPDLEEIIKLHAHDAECGSHVARTVEKIVRKSSYSQTAKGLLTAGLLKSLRYSSSKVIKRIKSR